MNQANDKPHPHEFLTYNPKLKERAREMRNNPTPAESRMWEILRLNDTFKEFRFHRQKPIGQYIVDFYCTKLKLAIEIDGATHLEDEAKEYDRIRSEALGVHGIRVVRFTNDEVLEDSEKVRGELIQFIKQNPPAPFDKGV